MPEPSLTQAYATLGLEPDCPWDDVRRQHKRLAFAWHPDRHANTPDAKVALERAKEINAAYDTLSAHYRDQAQRDVRADAYRVEDAPIHANSSMPSERRHARPYVLAAVAACAGVFWLLTKVVLNYDSGSTYLSDTRPTPGQTTTTQNVVNQSGSLESARHDLPVQIGMNTEAVIRVAGVPTRNDGDLWYYGDARVYFRHGVVTHMRRAGEFDVAMSPVARDNRDHFTYGSSMEEVRRIQGTPAAEGDTQWTYGPSQIYFRNGYVSGWYSSPLQPLKIANP